MRCLLQVVLGLSLSFVIVGSGVAAEKKAKKTRPSPAAAVFAVPAAIELTDDQKTKLEELKKEHEPKLTEAFEKRDGVLTAEQKKARADAQKAAKSAGKKGKDAKAAVDAAVSLTEEQKKNLAEAEKSLGELQKTVRGKIQELLTPEQREAIAKAKKEKQKPAPAA